MSAIGFSLSSLKEGRWYEHPVRFALGGAATVFTELVSSRYGASIGGLFLALTAIFCASATHRKHEIRRKRDWTAGDAVRRPPPSTPRGAVLGALGMLAFAIIFSLTVERSVTAAFIGAPLRWLLVSTG